MYRPLRALPLGAAASLLALSCSSSGTSPAPATTLPATRAPLASTAGVKGAAVSLGVAATSSTSKGSPRMLRAVKRVLPPTAMTAEAAARFHVDRLAPVWFKGGAGADLELIGIHAMRGGGSIVRFRQRVGGVEIYRGELRVLVGKDGALKSLSGTRYPHVAGSSFDLDAPKALSTVLGGKYKAAVAAPAIVAKRASGDFQSLTVPPRTDLVVNDARAKQVLVDVDGKLQAAWFLEMFSSRSLSQQADATRFLVSANDGRTLAEHNLTADEAHEYRVFADATGEKRPFDGPVQDFTPHPRGIPDGTKPAYVEPNLVSIDGFNQHRDPWIDAATTVTTGNNVDVFTDRNDDDLPTAPDFRAEKTGPLAFDYTYDTARDALDGDGQARAAMVHLFYTINWLHDWWYDSGFNESTGNAQEDNYGRGGAANDRMRANAQDGAITSADCNNGPCRSNANMSTPSDGSPPRMQMYLFTNDYPAIALTPGGEIEAGSFGFGPQEFDITGDVVLVNDNSTDTTNTTPGTFTDGCQAPVNDVSGKIALLDRGACDFVAKARNVQTAGAIGVIIANHLPGSAVNSGVTDPTITIPANGASLLGGTALKAALQNGPVSARLRRVVDVELSGDLDTGIVAHEWGHYFHHRLSECNTEQCGAMSEGWGDFVALHLLVRGTDNFDGAFAAGGLYSLHANANGAYYGVRRYPYSVDVTKNPLTFGHIADSAVLPTNVPTSFVAAENSEVHNAGEIWASMLWESYRALLREHDYETARRRMGDYMVTGLLLAPPDGTMTEVRDAILEAIGESDTDDQMLVAQAFARRGAGSCAVAPPADSQDFEGVEENYEVGAALAADALEFADDGLSCDNDGRLDRGETATLRFELANSGLFAANNVRVNVTTETPGIEIESATIETLGPGATQDIVIEVTAGDDLPTNALATFTVAVTSDNSCNGVEEVVFARVGVDEVQMSSATETAEAFTVPWTATGQFSQFIWARATIENGAGVLSAINAPVTTDTSFVSPVLSVGQEPFTVTLTHRYLLEASPVEDGGPLVLFDGGVIEISTDDGATWRDVTALGAAPAYNGALVVELPDFGYVSENPLAGQNAYSGSNPSLPGFDTETLSFGTALAGQNVRLRFRVGTDQGTGLYGWDIDSVAFAGISNTPFTAIVADDATCAFTVNAGPDQTVESGAAVTLTGTTSMEPTSIAWTLVSGPAVTLTGADTATATFTAPTVTETTVLVFKLTASNGTDELSDEVQVTVNPITTPPPDAGMPLPDAGMPQPDAGGGGDDGDDDGDDDGCGCRATSPAAAGNLLLPLAAVVLALRRRRKRS
jgi:MYXO-CTERM domain-containing protein